MINLKGDGMKQSLPQSRY